MLRNKLAIEEAPLQLYSSALIFTPSKSMVRTQFMHLIPSWITQVPEPEEDWTSELCTLSANGVDVPMSSLSFSPVDDLIVAGSIGMTAIWDYVTGTELYRFEEPDTIYCVAFSPDGKTFASGSEDNTIRIREFAKGRSIDLKGHTDYVYRVAFSPKSNNILASISTDETLRIWNIKKKQAVHIINTSPKRVSTLGWRGLAFSPGGDFVAVGSNARGPGSVTLWGVDKGKLKTVFEGHKSYVPAVAIHPSGEAVISGSNDGTIKVWNAKTGQTQYEICYDKAIEIIQFCPPNGEHVMIRFSSEVVEIRKTNTWDLVGNVHTNGCFALSVSRDGQFLAGTTIRNGIRIRDMRKAGSDVLHRDAISSVTFFPGKENDVMTCSGDLLQLWDANNALVMSTPGFLSEMLFSADKRFVGILSDHSFVEIWSQRMTRKIARYEETRDLVFSPTGSHIAIQLPHKCKIIDLTTLKVMAELDCIFLHFLAF